MKTHFDSERGWWLTEYSSTLTITIPDADKELTGQEYIFYYTHATVGVGYIRLEYWGHVERRTKRCQWQKNQLKPFYNSHESRIGRGVKLSEVGIPDDLKQFVVNYFREQITFKENE